MLATRLQDTGIHWRFKKTDATYRRPASPRMSDTYATSLSTQPEWPSHYTYPQHGETVTFSHSFERKNDLPNLRVSSSAGDRSNSLDVQVKEEDDSPLNQHQSRDRGKSPQNKAQSTGLIHRQGHHSVFDITRASGSFHAEPPATTNAAGESLEPDQRCSSQGVELSSPEESFLGTKDEDDDVMDDDDLFDGDGDQLHRPQTAAERTAARRKMKRFRLTHQQTRFLMSEFVKQPHPDAAHRERLSREIPGLSSRQVQVWFQNRRAKIKRLNAEDRDRVIKMRAVPEDFDNVQALHSPYGAVHGLAPSLPAPSEIVNQSYGDHMMRPLMADARRPEGGDSVSPTKLIPSFEGVGFNHSGAGNSDMMSGLSSSSNDRFAYGSPLSSLFGGPRALSTFQAGHSKLDQQGMRPLHPLHYRDSVSRPRAESLQSPLRSGMSWKGDNIDYSNYHLGSTSPSLTQRQQSMYSMSSTSNGGTGGGDTDSYPSEHRPRTYASAQTKVLMSDHLAQSSTGLGLEYPSLHQDIQSRTRSRAASATFPLSQDMKNQYRGLGSTGESSGYTSAASSQYTSSSVYTTSYLPAPLEAPNNISQPLSSNPRGGASSHSGSHLSGTIASPGFTRTFSPTQRVLDPMHR